MRLDDSTAELVALAGVTRALTDKIPPPAGAAVCMAAEALDEALVRLGMPLSGESQDPQQDPLILRCQARIRSDE